MLPEVPRTVHIPEMEIPTKPPTEGFIFEQSNQQHCCFSLCLISLFLYLGSALPFPITKLLNFQLFADIFFTSLVLLWYIASPTVEIQKVPNSTSTFFFFFFPTTGSGNRDFTQGKRLDIIQYLAKYTDLGMVSSCLGLYNLCEEGCEEKEKHLKGQLEKANIKLPLLLILNFFLIVREFDS